MTEFAAETMLLATDWSNDWSVIIAAIVIGAATLLKILVDWLREKDKNRREEKIEADKVEREEEREKARIKREQDLEDARIVREQVVADRLTETAKEVSDVKTTLVQTTEAQSAHNAEQAQQTAEIKQTGHDNHDLLNGMTTHNLKVIAVTTAKLALADPSPENIAEKNATQLAYDEHVARVAANEAAKQ